MYKQLKKLLQTKELFEDSDNLYWDDPYISKNLLNAHLSSYSDNASRNQDFMDASITFIDSILKKHRLHKIIDYGCGPGLYTEKLAILGYDVTGIDFSKRSIDYAVQSAKEKSLNINYRYENYLTTNESEIYDFASLIYCDFGSLSFENRSLLLNNIYRSLKPGGFFLMDAFTAEKFMNFKETQTWSYNSKSFWHESEHFEYIHDEAFENFISLQKLIIISEDESKVINRWYQHFTKDMLEDALNNANFITNSFYNNLKGEEFNSSNETVAFLMQKPE